MKPRARIAAISATALALAVGGAGSALASHGADDPPGHHHGKHHEKHHGKHKHRGGKHHQGHGADDGPNHT